MSDPSPNPPEVLMNKSFSYWYKDFEKVWENGKSTPDKIYDAAIALWTVYDFIIKYIIEHPLGSDDDLNILRSRDKYLETIKEFIDKAKNNNYDRDRWHENIGRGPGMDLLNQFCVLNEHTMSEIESYCLSSCQKVTSKHSIYDLPKDVDQLVEKLVLEIERIKNTLTVNNMKLTVEKVRSLKDDLTELMKKLFPNEYGSSAVTKVTNEIKKDNLAPDIVNLVESSSSTVSVPNDDTISPIDNIPSEVSTPDPMNKTLVALYRDFKSVKDNTEATPDQIYTAANDFFTAYDSILSVILLHPLKVNENMMMQIKDNNDIVKRVKAFIKRDNSKNFERAEWLGPIDSTDSLTLFNYLLLLLSDGIPVFLAYCKECIEEEQYTHGCIDITDDATLPLQTLLEEAAKHWEKITKDTSLSDIKSAVEQIIRLKGELAKLLESFTPNVPTDPDEDTIVNKENGEKLILDNVNIPKSSSSPEVTALVPNGNTISSGGGISLAATTTDDPMNKSFDELHKAFDRAWNDTTESAHIYKAADALYTAYNFILLFIILNPLGSGKDLDKLNEIDDRYVVPIKIFINEGKDFDQVQWHNAVKKPVGTLEVWFEELKSSAMNEFKIYCENRIQEELDAHQNVETLEGVKQLRERAETQRESLASMSTVNEMKLAVENVMKLNSQVTELLKNSAPNKSGSSEITVGKEDKGEKLITDPVNIPKSSFSHEVTALVPNDSTISSGGGISLAATTTDDPLNKSFDELHKAFDIAWNDKPGQIYIAANALCTAYDSIYKDILKHPHTSKDNMDDLKETDSLYLAPMKAFIERGETFDLVQWHATFGDAYTGTLGDFCSELDYYAMDEFKNYCKVLIQEEFDAHKNVNIPDNVKLLRIEAKAQKKKIASTLTVGEMKSAIENVMKLNNRVTELLEMSLPNNIDSSTVTEVKKEKIEELMPNNDNIAISNSSTVVSSPVLNDGTISSGGNIQLDDKSADPMTKSFDTLHQDFEAIWKDNGSTSGQMLKAVTDLYAAYDSIYSILLASPLTADHPDHSTKILSDFKSHTLTPMKTLIDQGESNSLKPTQWRGEGFGYSFRDPLWDYALNLKQTAFSQFNNYCSYRVNEEKDAHKAADKPAAVKLAVEKLRQDTEAIQVTKSSMTVNEVKSAIEQVIRLDDAVILLLKTPAAAPIEVTQKATSVVNSIEQLVHGTNGPEVKSGEQSLSFTYLSGMVIFTCMCVILLCVICKSLFSSTSDNSQDHAENLTLNPKSGNLVRDSSADVPNFDSAPLLAHSGSLTGDASSLHFASIISSSSIVMLVSILFL